MPIIRRNYLDLSLAQRREGARKARERISTAMAVPGLTSHQVQDLQNQLNKIEAWEKGKPLHTAASPGRTSSEVTANLPAKLQGRVQAAKDKQAAMKAAMKAAAADEA